MNISEEEGAAPPGTGVQAMNDAYNGWSNRKTWTVAKSIFNVEDFRLLAGEADSWYMLRNVLSMVDIHELDGVDLDDPELSRTELDEAVASCHAKDRTH